MFRIFSTDSAADDLTFSRSGASLTTQVTHHIRQMIITGALPLGSSISEMALAEKFGISKSPVRSALKSLAEEGLVHIYPQRGTFVFAPSKDEWICMSEFRRHLELQCLETAYTKNKAALVQNMTAVMQEMTKAYDEKNAQHYIQQDILFHLSIVTNTKNIFFSKAYNLIVAKVATVLLYLGVDWGQIERSYGEHRTMAALLENGQYDEARALFQNHLNHAQIFYALAQDQHTIPTQ